MRTTHRATPRSHEKPHRHSHSKPRLSLTRLGMTRLSLALLTAALLLPAVGCETSNPELRHRGRSAYLSGDYDQARQYYTRAAEQRPTDVEAQYRLGEVYLALDQPGRAESVLSDALALSRDDRARRIEIMDALAEAMYQDDQYDALHAFLENAVDDYGTMADVLRQARYLEKMGDIDGAERAYRQAARYAAETEADEAMAPEPFIELARFYQRINDVPNEIQALRWAHYVAPENEQVRRRLLAHEVIPGPTAGERPPGIDDAP